jgi:hypothetical protein
MARLAGSDANNIGKPAASLVADDGFARVQ